MDKDNPISITFLSKEAQNEISKLMAKCIEQVTNNTLEFNSYPELLSQKQACEFLQVNPNTLYSYEQYGLKRYSPPIEDSRKVWYLKKEILSFIGVTEA